MPRLIEVVSHLTRQALWLVASAACTSALLWPLLADNASPPAQPATVDGQASGGEHVLELRRELAQMQVQNAALLRRVDALHKQLEALPQTAHRFDDDERPLTVDAADGVARQMQIGEQEATLAAQGDLWQDDFSQMEEQFYGESADADWAATMQRDMGLIEARLSQLANAGTSIGYHECRSRTCRVEFIHEGTAPALLPALIAAPHSSRISTRTAHTDEGEMTVALYRR